MMDDGGWWVVVMVVQQVGWAFLWALASLGVSTNGTTKTLTSITGQSFPLSQCITYTTTGPDTTFSPSCLSGNHDCYKCVCGSGSVVVWDNAPCFNYRFYFGTYFLMLLGFLWACAVIKNIVHCTVSGAVAMWWFSGERVGGFWLTLLMGRGVVVLAVVVVVVLVVVIQK